MVGLSFITFTRNSANRIGGLLEHVKDIVDEIVVVDGYSTDETIEVARSYGARVYQRKSWGYVEPDRMFALAQTSHPWILYLDDDERLCRRLKANLRELIEFGVRNNISAFSVTRVNLTKRKRPILGPFYPDRQIRIYDKNRILYKGIVHELPKVRGKIYDLEEKYYILHLGQSFWSKKQAYYALLEGKTRYEYPHRGKVRRILWRLMPLTTFAHYSYLLYAYLLKQKRPFNDLGLIYTFRNSLYESLVSVVSKLRTEKQRKMAKVLEGEGLVRFKHQ